MRATIVDKTEMAVVKTVLIGGTNDNDEQGWVFLFDGFSWFCFFEQIADDMMEQKSV